MSEFFVHWNSIRKRVRIHRAECGACNHGEGMHRGKIAAGRGVTYDWVGFEAYAGALGFARKRSVEVGATARLDCGLCNPHLSGTWREAGQL